MPIDTGKEDVTTRAPTIFGDQYDAPAKLPDAFERYEAKRFIALAALNRAERESEGEIAQVAKWELGLIDVRLATRGEASPFAGGDFDAFAGHYGLTEKATEYARARASETEDVILKVHYLAFVRLRAGLKDKASVDLGRELLGTWRAYIEGCIESPSKQCDDFVGVNLEHALSAVGTLFQSGGVVKSEEAARWAEWIVSLAERSRDLPVRSPAERDQQRHRWIADYLIHLTELPSHSIASGVRKAALDLITEAEAYYTTTPLNDDFAQRVAKVEATILDHFGETGTHERMIRKMFAALKQRAEFHRATGNGIITAHFFREARKILETHRQYFRGDEAAALSLAERTAIQKAVDGGEFAVISMPITIPMSTMDFTEGTAEATISRLYRECLASVPSKAELMADALALAADTPLQSLMPRTVIGSEKVVGEADSPEGNTALDVEQRTVLMATLLGAAVALTIQSAAETEGLTADHLMTPLAPLDLDAGSVVILTQGCDRLIAKDFVSATHILIPHIEDVLRQHLTFLGVDTQKFKRESANTSRTDDATLGRLLTQVKFPDGRSVKQYLGEDIWSYLDALLNSQTGLTLRHNFAHGLARPTHTTQENAGIAISLLYVLAGLASRTPGTPVINDD